MDGGVFACFRRKPRWIEMGKPWFSVLYGCLEKLLETRLSCSGLLCFGILVVLKFWRWAGEGLERLDFVVVS